MRRWVGDLALGLRLAVSGRSSLTRFLLSTVGIAMGVAALLLGASIGTMAHQHDLRAAATSTGPERPVDGVDPLYQSMQPTVFRGERVELVYVYAEGENHPLPRGMERLPGPGEVLASTALAELLASPDGELLRPRVPGEIVGELPRSVVVEPDDLVAYLGAGAELAESPNVHPVYEFDGQVQESEIPPDLMVVLLIGTVVLLVPVFVFVGTSSRVAGVERDRRLSALRMVGADARQVRRIAAAEALVSALAGLVAGAGLFLFARTFAEEVELFDRRVYRDDVVPDPVLTVLIALAVPVLAVLAAQFASRRTVIEPLGVVRHTRPIRRRAWWRLALVAAGAVLLATGGGTAYGTDLWFTVLVAGAAMLLFGVPLLLPWLVEWAVRRLRGGPSSWQLAIRRLQLDSGTPARVVGGISVVLAGAIALQTIVLTVEGDLQLPAGQPPPSMFEVLVEDPGMVEDVAENVAGDLEDVPSVRGAYGVLDVTAYQPNASRLGDQFRLSIMDCEGVRVFAGDGACTDGDVFAWPDSGPMSTAGARLEFRDYGPRAQSMEDDDYEVTGTWTVPAVEQLPDPNGMMRVGDLLATPGALAGLRLPDQGATVLIDAIRPGADDIERIRNSLGEYGWRTYMFNGGHGLNPNQQKFVAVRNALYAGSVFTLLLAGLSLLVLAVEHLRERRRPLAVLVASGVPRAVLARSLMWQVVLPIVLGVVVAVVSGVGLAWLVLRATRGGLAVDWVGVGLLSAGAVVLAVLVAAMTLPFLRGATRLTSLRTE